jgi:hypothetical protein
MGVKFSVQHLITPKITSLFETYFLKPFKILCFPQASWLKNYFIDQKRIEKSKQDLVKIGGKCLNLKTPDGDKIEAMYFACQNLKQQLNEYFELVEKKQKKIKFINTCELKKNYVKKNL